MILYFYAGMIFLYIMIAKKLQLTDAPSLRSSHKEITITAAGFIFPIAFFLPLAYTGEFIHYRSTLTGLLLNIFSVTSADFAIFLTDGFIFTEAHWYFGPW
jgi:hypothetical protein